LMESRTPDARWLPYSSALELKRTVWRGDAFSSVIQDRSL
jgi:hypothetical protein